MKFSPSFAHLTLNPSVPSTTFSKSVASIFAGWQNLQCLGDSPPSCYGIPLPCYGPVGVGDVVVVVVEILPCY